MKRVLGAVTAAVIIAVGVMPQPAAAAGLTKTVTATRVHLVDGVERPVDRRTVSVTVDQTTGLRDRQTVNVSWRGAHPTGGVVLDPNSSLAANQQEYPVVLLQCRGKEGAGLRRETCFTQSPPERWNGGYSTPFPSWRLDRAAPLAERQRYINVPTPRPSGCRNPALAERWLPFVAANGNSYPGGPPACAQQAPEAIDIGTSSLALPGNTTYGATRSDGTGSARFNVRTAENNASLGCSQRVVCSLVVIPIVGISCDAQASMLPADQRPEDEESAADAASSCMADGVYAPGQPNNPSTFADPSVVGALWWSESNWRHRITVPLSFAPASNTCDIVGADSVDLYGSELAVPATQQWAPTFCLDPKRIPFKHVQTGEPQARNLLKAGSVNAALTSHAPEGGYGRPVVSAPIGMSGFAIGFTVDGDDKRELQQLKLSPRLLAKLITQSYTVNAIIKSGYTALSNNPLDITQDPEFRALNPGAPTSSRHVAAATLLNLSSGSDVVSALTGYIDADPEARAWLDGQPDSSGMVVNPNYKGITLPVDTWELRDTYQYEYRNNRCLEAAPVPYLPLVAAPLGRLAGIAQAMQFSIGNSQIVCIDPGIGFTEGLRLSAVGRQPQGGRFMLGLMALADAERYQVSTASLQSSAQRFVAPTATSLRAAVRALQADEATGTWDFPYGDLPADAYPGAMVAYAAVPTSGLSKREALGYASFVRFAATKGQVPGAQTGELPAGFLPMTASNGLGALASFSLRAADAIEAQAAAVPTLATPAVTAPTVPPSAAPGQPVVPPLRPSSPVLPTVQGPTSAPAPVVAPTALTVSSVRGATIGPRVGAIGAVLPTLLLVGVLVVIGGQSLLWRARASVR